LCTAVVTEKTVNYRLMRTWNMLLMKSSCRLPPLTVSAVFSRCVLVYGCCQLVTEKTVKLQTYEDLEHALDEVVMQAACTDVECSV